MSSFLERLQAKAKAASSTAEAEAAIPVRRPKPRPPAKRSPYPSNTAELLAAAKAEAAEDAAELDELIAAAGRDPNAEPPSSRKRKAPSSAGGMKAGELQDLDELPPPAWLIDDGTDAFLLSRRWPEDLVDVMPKVAELTAADLPAGPFKLQPWVTIGNGAVWLKHIQREVAQGVTGPRARLGGLQEDVRFLFFSVLADEPKHPDKLRNQPAFA